MDTSQIQEMLKTGLGTLTLERVLTALVILVICLIVIRLALRIVRGVLERTETGEPGRKYILSAVRLVLYILTALLVAASLDIDVTSLVAFFSVLSLAISLAVQDVLGNVAGGIVIMLTHPFVLGDYISTGDSEGTVAEINLTHTKLNTAAGLQVMLPNSTMTAGKIINYTVRGVRRVDHEVSASYDDRVDVVRAACMEVIARTPNVLDDPAPHAVITAYGDSAIVYHFRFWTKSEHYWDALNFSLEEVSNVFAERGITMTYNHLNVHILDETTKKSEN